MSRRRKLIERMRLSPDTIRFDEVVALLAHESFVCTNRVGSHWTFRRPGQEPFVLVRPHGGRKTCFAHDIRNILAAMEES